MGGPSSIDGIFYTNPAEKETDSKGHVIYDRSEVVPAEFLTIRGQKVRDPYLTKDGGGSAKYTLYSKLNSNGTVDENSVFQNAGNYLIVPAKGNNLAEAVEFAAQVNAEMAAASRVSLVRGLLVVKRLMEQNFRDNGSQDLQRGTKYGVPAGEFVPAFTDGAAFNFGFVMQQVDLPNWIGKAGAGIYNLREYFGDKIHNLHSAKKIFHELPDGPFGMSRGNALNFGPGARAAEALGFHKTVTEHTQSILGSFAPLFRGGTPNLDHTKPGKHTAGYGVHAAIMTEMGRSPAPQVGTSRLAPDGSGLFEAKNKGGFGESSQGSGGISAAMSSDPGPFASFRKPRGNSQGPFQNTATGAGGDFGHPQAGMTRGLMSQEFFSGGQGRASELASFAPGSRHGGQAGSGSIRNRGVADHGGAFSPGARGRPADGMTLKKAVASRSLDDRDAGVPQTPHRDADVMDERRFGRRLRDFFDQEARLPPSGGTGFDPRLSPAWPGLKLPA